MFRRKTAFGRIFLPAAAVFFARFASAAPVPVAAPSPAPAVEPAPAYAFGFARANRVAGELHRSLGSPIAQKKQGIGAGLAVLFPLADSNFDLGIRYVYVREDKDPVFPGGPRAFTLLTFVFDYYLWPTKLGGFYVGGEVGVTDPAAGDFFSVYSDYAFVAKLGYEFTVPGTRWSATFEARRSVRDDAPLEATRESQLYSNDLALGVRYRLDKP